MLSNKSLNPHQQDIRRRINSIAHRLNLRFLDTLLSASAASGGMVFGVSEATQERSGDCIEMIKMTTGDGESKVEPVAMTCNDRR